MALINTNQLYIKVYDFTGTPSLCTYALQQTPLTFVPDYTLVRILSTVSYISPLTSYTNTVYVPDTNDYSNLKVRWDFGDGTYQISPTGIHAYEFPGQYKVKLYLINENGESYLNTFVANVNIYNYIEDKNKFAPSEHFIIDIPAGRLSDKLSLIRQNSWQSYPVLSGFGYTYNLYSSGAGTYYYDVKNYYKDKWAHLKKFFKFVEKQVINGIEQDVIIDKINTTNTEIYASITNNALHLCQKEDEGAFLVGTSGTADFYYTDDSNKNNISINDPIFIFANLDTSRFYDSLTFKDKAYQDVTPLPLSYLNTIPAILPIVKTRYNPAAAVTITSNGIDGEGEDVIESFNLSKTSYATTKIPFVIKLKDQFNYTTKSYPYLSSTNTTPNSSYFFQLKLLDSNNNEIPNTIFYKTDFEKEIFNSGGFYRGYFTTDNTVLSAKLSANVYIDDIPNFEQDTAIIYYSQPYSDSIARYFSTNFYTTIPGIPFQQTITYDFLNTQGNRSIFTITQIPSSNNSYQDYCLWAADSDFDRILKMDYNGNIIANISLSAAPLSSGEKINLLYNDSSSPCSIAIDKNNNAFVTLFDSNSVIKINNNTNLIDKVVSLGTNSYISSAFYTNYSGYVGENIILPSSIDVDKDNNVFVVLSHPLCSFIFKYDNNLNFQSSVSQATAGYYFQKIIVDRNNKIWATAYNKNINPCNIENRNDKIFLYNNNLNLLSSFSNFYLPSDITVDGNQNCWVAHGISTVSKIDHLTYSRYNFNVGEVYGNITNHIQSIEGISCNSLNEIVILNNFDQKIYFLNASLTEQPDLNTVKNIPFKSAPNNFAQYPISAYYDSKYQAEGDFLGYKWINKYYYFKTNLRMLTGTSSTFNIYPASGYNLLFKNNENFDGEQMYKNFALMETLQDKKGLFDDFLGKIVGNTSSNANNALLKKIYEKIANYTDNIADVNTCNVDALINKCNMFGVIYENYNYPYPATLNRVIDLASIKRNRLFGNKNNCQYSFKTGENLGSIVDVTTDTFSATEIIVAHEKFSNKFKPVNTTLIAGYSTDDIIPFSEYNYDWGWGLVVPSSLSGIYINGYYDFYRLKTTEQHILNNLLDFDKSNTNLTFNLSTYDDFYGQDGIIDQNITYALVNGLRLISSATNVYYN
jgi:hypothetical protein